MKFKNLLTKVSKNIFSFVIKLISQDEIHTRKPEKKHSCKKQ
jgi:hypothetical protein